METLLNLLNIIITLLMALALTITILIVYLAPLMVVAFLIWEVLIR